MAKQRHQHSADKKRALKRKLMTNRQRFSGTGIAKTAPAVL